jgi:hypothetical protein
MTRWALAMALTALLGGCTFVASYPGVEPEDTEAACSDGVDNDLDGDTDCADADCATFCPSMEVVAPTSLLPCFADEGVAFREEADRPEPTCEPFPAAPPTCDPGDALFPGTDACVTLGAPCGDPFKADLDADEHVQQGEGGDGADGSMEFPWGLVVRAAIEVQDGGIISVAEGEYPGHLTLTRPMHIVGACPARTRLIGVGATQPVIRVQSPGVILEGFTLSGIGPGIVVEQGGSVVLRDVIIDDAGGDAIRVSDAFLDGERVVVRNVRGADGAVLRATDGAQVVLSSVLFEDAAGAGLVADGGTVDIRASTIRRTGADGVHVAGEGRLLGRGLTVASSGTVGIHASCTGSDPDDPCLDLEDAIVRHPTASGAGMLVELGHVTLTRTLVDGSSLGGLRVVGGHVQLSHVVVTHTRRGSDQSGTGVSVLGGAVLEGRHVRLRANEFNGLVVDEATATLRDLQILGEQAGGTSGVGIRARSTASLDLARFAVDAAGLCGLQLDAEVAFTGTDGVIAGSARGACVPRDAFTPEQMSGRITYSGNDRNIVVE